MLQVYRTMRYRFIALFRRVVGSGARCRCSARIIAMRAIIGSPPVASDFGSSIKPSCSGGALPGSRTLQLSPILKTP
jgi:hypothetical protein